MERTFKQRGTTSLDQSREYAALTKEKKAEVKDVLIKEQKKDALYNLMDDAYEFRDAQRGAFDLKSYQEYTLSESKILSETEIEKESTGGSAPWYYRKRDDAVVAYTGPDENIYKTVRYSDGRTEFIDYEGKIYTEEGYYNEE